MDGLSEFLLNLNLDTCYLSKMQSLYGLSQCFISTNISAGQFGFLPNRSTLQQLLLFLNEIVNSRSPVEVIYLDFKKAFDSVAPHELLHKFMNFGVIGNVWYWLENYLISVC